MKDIDSIIVEIKKHTKISEKQMDKIKNKTIKTNEKLFSQATKLLFKKYPNLEKFSWHQYTPSWNDGDECVFSANISDLYINNSDESVDAYSLKILLTKMKSKNFQNEKQELLNKIEENKDDTYLQHELTRLERNPDEVKLEFEMVSDITSILDSFQNDLYKDMFGEGTVVVTAESIATECYEHD